MANNFTGKNASDATVTFAGRDYSSVQYPGGVLFFESSSAPVLVSSSNPLPIVVQEALPAGSNFVGNVGVTNALPAGTNNIGDVDILTLPASAATTDTVTAKLDVSSLHSGLTALTPKFAVIDAATSGNNTLVAAVAAKRILVHSYVLVASGTVTARFESGADGTALTGQMSLVAQTVVSAPFNPAGHFRASTNTLLNLELSGAVSVDGHLTYTEVD